MWCDPCESTADRTWEGDLVGKSRLGEFNYIDSDLDTAGGLKASAGRVATKAVQLSQGQPVGRIASSITIGVANV